MAFYCVSYVFSVSVAHAFDLHLDTQNYLAMGLSFMFSTNQFFPILDGYIPIFALWVTIYTVLGVLKGFEIGFNAIRGAGLRL